MRCRCPRKFKPVSTSAPQNFVLPYFFNTGPIVGNVISSLSYSRGVWTGAPVPTFTDEVLKNGVPVVLPYTIVGGDAGAVFTVRVRAQNPSNIVYATSLPTSPVVAAPVAPTNTGPLPFFLDTTPTEGDTITQAMLDPGGWTASPSPAFSYQLKRNGVNVSLPYPIVNADVGATFTFVVTATNTAGSNSATSLATAPVAAIPVAPTNSVLPSIVDTTPMVGDTIDVAGLNDGVWAGVPYPSFTKVLKKNGTNVTLPYLVVSGDIGSTFTWTVIGYNVAGNLTKVSLPTSPVTAAGTAPVNTSLPTLVDANPVVGETINLGGTTDGIWTGTPTITYARQLKRNGTNVTMPYLVVIGDVGAVFTFQVTATNGSGSDIKTSLPTNAVLPAPPVNTRYAADFTVGVDPSFYVDGKYIRWNNKNWYLDCANNPGQFFSPNNKKLVFKVSPGDRFINLPSFQDSVGVERNKLCEANADWHPPSTEFHFAETITLASPAASTTFFVCGEQHTFGTSVLAAKFELIVRNGYWGITANYNSGPGVTQTRTLWDNILPVVYDVPHDIEVFVRTDPTGGTGRVIVWIDGVLRVNFTGNVGYISESQWLWEFGIYRGRTDGVSAPQISIVTHDNYRMEFGAYGTLTPPVSAPSGPPAAPVNTALPTLVDTTPQVGDVISTSSSLNGTWTGSFYPTFSKVLKVGGVVKTMPYTVLTGDIGSTVVVEVAGMNSEGSATASTLPSSAITAAVENLGANILANGDMVNISSWLVQNATQNNSDVAGKLTLIAAAPIGNNNTHKNATSPTSGVNYRVKGKITNVDCPGGAAIGVLGNVSSAYSSYVTSTSETDVSFIYPSDATFATVYLQLQPSAAGQKARFTLVSMQEILP